MSQEMTAEPFRFEAFADLNLLDGHTHPWAGLDPDTYWKALARTGARRVNVLSLPNLEATTPDKATLNAEALAVKRALGGRAYAFGSFDYSTWVRERAMAPQDLVRQAERMLGQGFDGIKMWEGKPSVYVLLPDRLEGPFYAPFFAWAEAQQCPLTLHLADAPRFWDPARVGLDRWSFAASPYPKRFEMYDEVGRLLRRHPRLRLIIAHFSFFWAELDYASRFLDAHPTVALDLAPAIGGYIDLSADPEGARRFFLRYADRILYGTDIGTGAAVDPGLGFDMEKETAQAWLVRAFLETDWDLPLPSGVGPFGNAFAGRRLRGIALPREALAQIYGQNFIRLAGARPRTVQP